MNPISAVTAAVLFLALATSGGSTIGDRDREDTETALFGRDHWLVSPRLAVDLGIRAESQELSESFRVAPRAGIAWTPFARAGTVIRAGFGLFYDRVPLNVYSFSHYPSRLTALFKAPGQVSFFGQRGRRFTAHFDVLF